MHVYVVRVLDGKNIPEHKVTFAYQDSYIDYLFRVYLKLLKASIFLIAFYWLSFVLVLLTLNVDPLRVI